ncbi:MAG: 4-hydroxy-tetrahydrodipicolinate synthase [Oscillospiraceae bacterium]|nr:4-hydroxy-tetrahydrodipicolinate synthase [Oscillospiraceae bacterium]
MKTPIFTGSGVAIVTPFEGDCINFKLFGQLIDWHIDNGTNAIIVCGTTGEASTLSIPEHLSAVEFAVKHTAKRMPVVAGTGSNDTNDALHMSQSAQKLGADGLLVVTPYYNKTSQRGLVKHFETIADAVNIPIMLYNIPYRAGMGFQPDTYKILSKHPNINGVKEASGDFTLISRTRALCGNNLHIWSGNDDNTLPILSMGGQGVVSTTANVAPRMMSDLCRLCFEGKFSEARAMAMAHQALFDALFVEVNPIPVKTALSLMGWNVGPLRMPLCDMYDEQVAILRLVLAGYDLV